MQGKQIHDLQFLQLFNSCLMDLIMSTEKMQFKLIWILNMIFTLIDKKCIKSEFKRFISVSVIYKNVLNISNTPLLRYVSPLNVYGYP